MKGTSAVLTSTENALAIRIKPVYSILLLPLSLRLSSLKFPLPRTPTTAATTTTSFSTMPRNRPKGNSSEYGRRENGRPVAISKSLSYILRHAAEREGLKIDAQGYLNVADVVCTTLLDTSVLRFMGLLMRELFEME